MMKVFIIGSTGGVGKRLAKRLVAEGQDAVGLIRNPEQAHEIAGALPVLGDIAKLSIDQLADKMRGCDVVVFTAGAGGHDGPESTSAVDGNGPLKTAQAMMRAGIKRFYLVSVFPEAWRERRMDDDFEHYMVEKKKAETEVVLTDLDWVILRPSALTDHQGTSRVDLGFAKFHGQIDRDDVAETLVELIRTPGIRRVILEATAGTEPIDEAVASLTNAMVGG